MSATVKLEDGVAAEVSSTASTHSSDSKTPSEYQVYRMQSGKSMYELVDREKRIGKRAVIEVQVTYDDRGNKIYASRLLCMPHPYKDNGDNKWVDRKVVVLITSMDYTGTRVVHQEEKVFTAPDKELLWELLAIMRSDVTLMGWSTNEDGHADEQAPPPGYVFWTFFDVKKHHWFFRDFPSIATQMARRAERKKENKLRRRLLNPARYGQEKRQRGPGESDDEDDSDAHMEVASFKYIVS